MYDVLDHTVLLSRYSSAADTFAPQDMESQPHVLASRAWLGSKGHGPVKLASAMLLHPVKTVQHCTSTIACSDCERERTASHLPWMDVKPLGSN